MITDYHSHVLPGVDDGVRTLEESLAILGRLAREGVEALWLTPHVMEDVPNRTEDLLPFGERGDHLLVETSCFTPPLDLDGLLDSIRSAGYFPVLAHPERYFYLDRNDCRRLLEAGVKFQLNLGSPAGTYGRDVARKAKWLLRHGAYTIAGSDLHRERMIDTILSWKHPRRDLPLLQVTL